MTHCRAWLWTGGRFEPVEGVPVSDRGFRYGMSVFESFPVRNGTAAFLEQHLARLREACVLTGLEFPRGALDGSASVLAQAADGFARIYVTAGDGTVTEACEHCRVLILVEKREPAPARAYHRGYDLGMHPAGHVPVFAGLKTGNYWANLRAFREGVAAQSNETLLFTPAGHLISACMANVFIVTRDPLGRFGPFGRLRTPDPSTGARAGVVREWVMKRVRTEESILTRAEVEAADEIFLTSSWLGIMPAASIGCRKLGAREISAPLLEAYRKECAIP